jgi:PKD repeat protein
MTVLVLPAQGAATPPPPPALTSGPDAQPNPATAGTPVHFTAAASGSNVLYAWTFGDGTGDTGPAPTHVYATVGEYTAIVNASDTFGGNASGSVNVSVTPPPIPLPVSALAIKLDFAAAGKDRMTLAGTLPIPKDMNFSGQIVTVAIASITQPFSLDNRGAAKSGGARFKLLAKTKKGHVTVQNAVFSANLTHGNFAAALSAYGLANATVSKQAVTIPVVVSFNGQTFTANQAQVYSAKAGAWGLTK